MKEESKKLAAEALGTFGLVFLGAGAVIVEAHTGMSHLGKPEGQLGLTGIALAHGLTLAGMLCAVGSISGGHFNPAVSFAVWLRQKLKSSMLVGYVIAQVVGALVASMMLAAIFPDEVALAGLGTPALAAKISPMKGIAIEGIITFLLVGTILFATRDDNENRGTAGLSIGGTLAALILFAGPLTGAAANPARFLGPAVVSGNLRETFVYIVGPMIGGGAAGLLAAVAFGLGLGNASPDEEATEDDESDGEAPAKPAPRASKPITVHKALERAQASFVAGNGEEAAALLVPHLPRTSEYDAAVVDKIRSLIIVIEEEFGRIAQLDEFRDSILTAGRRVPSV